VRYLALIIGICGVASASIFARYGLGAGFPPAALAAWRLVFASICLIAFQLGRKSGMKLAKNAIVRSAIAGLFMAVHFATWIASLDYITVARSTLLVSTSPLWAGLAGLAIPSLRPKRIFWLGLAVAAIGTYLVTLESGPTHFQKGPPWIGDLLAVIGAICIVPYLVLSQQVQAKAGTMTTITWIYSAGAAGLVLFLLPQGRMPLPVNPAVWTSIAGMALFAQLVGHSMLNFCLRHFSAAQVATASLLEPVFAAGLAWIVFAERIALVQAIGGVILLTGVGVTLKSEPSEAVMPYAG